MCYCNKMDVLHCSDIFHTQGDFESVLGAIGTPQFVEQLMMALYEVSNIKTECFRNPCT